MNTPSDRHIRNRTTLRLPHPAADLTQRSNTRHRTPNASSRTIAPIQGMSWNPDATTARMRGSGAAAIRHKTVDINKREVSKWSAIDHMNSEPK
jgi:hypothetical protein